MMKKLNIVKGLTILMMSGFFTLSHAGGTAAGTAVNNTASLSFGDNVDELTAINSNTEQFVVDNKIDLTVTTLDVSAIQTKPGAIGVVLKYKVVNNGNNIQDFDLAARKSSLTAFSGVNEVTNNLSIDANNVNIYVDDGDGVYEVAEDNLQYIDELAIDAFKIVFIVVEIPVADIVNGDVAVYDLQVQVAESGTVGTKGNNILSDDRLNPDSALTVQIVFADGVGSISDDTERDGKHSSVNALIIVIADMSIIKVTLVLSDPVNFAVNPKRIPGATIRHCITVTNSGDAPAGIAKVTENLDPTQYVLTNLNNNNIKIYAGNDEFVCANATGDLSGGDTAIDASSGVILIDLDGVLANSAKSAFIDLVLQ